MSFYGTKLSHCKANAIYDILVTHAEAGWSSIAMEQMDYISWEPK